MEHIIGEYYECNGEIFRKLKLREGKCQIRTPEGKYMWVRPSDNTTFITRSDNITKPEAPSDKCDNTTFTTSSDNTTECDIITGSGITTSITESTGVQGVQCTDCTECDNTTPEPAEDIDALATELRNKLLRGGLYENWRYSTSTIIYRKRTQQASTFTCTHFRNLP